MEDAEDYYLSAMAKAKIGNEIEAIIDFDKAIELDPMYMQAYNNRGNAKRELGDYEGAIKDYNKSIEINPNYTIAYINKREVERRLKGWVK